VAQATPVIVINDVAKKAFWPDVGSVVGRHIVTPNGGRYEVVGVAKRSKYFSIGEDPRPYVYLAMQQGGARMLSVVARVSGDPSAATRQIVATIRARDPVAPVFDVQPMSQRVAVAMAPTSGGATGLTIVGLLALALTSLGLYGIVAQTVSRRTFEIGVRRALGAQDGDVVRLVLRDAMTLVTVGVVGGLAGALVVARPLRAVLYDVDPADPLVFGAAPVVLLMVCAVASSIPAWRAIRIDAATALRYE
jgi:putative ABC transport system permease protein